jgi:hypothetical protein
MKKLLIAAIMILGCMATSCTQTETAMEHATRLGLTLDVNSRALVEDWDSFWLMERSTRLSKWHSRLGY